MQTSHLWTSVNPTAILIVSIRNCGNVMFLPDVDLLQFVTLGSHEGLFQILMCTFFFERKHTKKMYIVWNVYVTGPNIYYLKHTCIVFKCVYM